MHKHYLILALLCFSLVKPFSHPFQNDLRPQTYSVTIPGAQIPPEALDGLPMLVRVHFRHDVGRRVCQFYSRPGN